MNWQQVETELKLLSKNIKIDPDIIVAIARGGLVPARLLANSLNVKTIYALTLQKEKQNRIILTKIEANLSDQKVLLVEDSLETGNNLLKCRIYLESLGAIVSTAALYIKKETITVPDYWLERRAVLPRFPWE
jgi:hypoxanthine phosphoribosyltransferase